MMQNSNYSQARFLTSTATLKDLPEDVGIEVAFIGRSNAGKSSALNALTGVKGLARTSKTPGRTQLINLFAINEDHRLVDLPGYGYAKAPKMMRDRWRQTVHDYLEQRKCLHGLVLMMDVRHPLKESDQRMIQWAIDCQLPVHILLTKADKLKRGAAMNALQHIRSALSTNTELVSMQLFSSLDKTGLDEARTKLDGWFGG